MRQIIFFVFVSLFLYAKTTPTSETAVTQPKELTIGINTSTNYANSSKIWQPTISYLNRSFKDYKFRVMYVKYSDIKDNIKNEEIDFLIIEPSLFVTLEKKFNLTLLGSVVRNKDKKNITGKSAVIFSNSDRADINILDDIHGKRLLVNSINAYSTKIAFGELLSDGLNPQLIFTNINELENGSDEDIVYKILSSKSDIGIVESGVIENMIKNNIIRKDSIKILNQKKDKNYPYIRSTEIYPDILIAKLSHTSEQDAKKLLSSLFLIQPSSQAAESANISSWYIPDRYDKVEELLDDIEILNSKNYYRDLALKIYSEKRIELISGFTMLILIIILMIREAILLKRIDKINSIDPLTGLYNRIKINKVLANEFQRSKRYGHPFSIIILDIMSLREINETYDQKIGDKVLEYIAEEIQKNIRVTDRPCRWSGEKFLVVCPNTEYNDTELLAKKIQTIIKEKDFFDDLTVLSAFGIANYEIDDESEDKMIERVNRSLDNCIIDK